MKPTRNAASPPDLLSYDSIYLPDSEGKLREVPRDATYEKWLEFLSQGLVRPTTLPPPSVAEIVLTGTADDERAKLIASLVIQNVQSEGYVPISLAMHEAYIRHVTYEGDGEFIFRSYDRTQGYTWWLRGAGQHRVTLELTVPIKKQAASRRLQLSLPDATQSRLNLTTMFPGVDAKSASGDLQVTNLPDQSRIELLGLGTRLDLNWKPIVAESPLAPLLESETTILAYASSESLQVEAYQALHVVQGSVSEVTVRLPPNAESPRVTGRDYRADRISSDDPSRVVVQLNGPSSGQIQLKWTFRLPIEDRRRFILDGLQVEQARKQSGRIGLIPADGLRLKVSQADHPHLLPINPAEFRTLSAQVSRAYRFFSQPFRMVIGVETIEPYFTLEPRLTLNATLDELTLDGVFSVNVLRGKLRSVELDWPNWKTDNWTIDSFEPQGELIEGIDPDIEDKPGRLRLRLVDEHSAQFVLRLRARRAIRAGETVTVSLPRFVSQDSAPTMLTLVEADNLSCEVTPVGETVLELQSADGKTAETSASGKSRSFRIRSGEQLFSLRTIRQERRLQVVSNTIVELAGTRLRGVQNFQFDVQHERLSQARLAVPENWRHDSLRFQIDADRALTPSWSAGETEGWAVAQLIFPEPRLGQFVVQAMFEVPLTESMLAGESPAEVPVFGCLDQPPRQYALQLQPSIESDLTVADASWKPRGEFNGQTRWIADAPVSSARIQLEAGDAASQQLLITDAELSAEWDRQGMALCAARYRISGAAARIGLVLPDGATHLQVMWDRQMLTEPVEITREAKPRNYTLRVRTEGTEQAEHELTIEYRLPAQQSFTLWNSWSLSVPQLPQANWMAQGRWSIRVPSDQHLFSWPSTATPRFRWQRSGAVWSRISPDDGVQHRTRSQDLDGPAPGNQYAFSQFGELRDFRFSTMSGPMIFLIGATISLVAGFVVLNIPGLRNLMTLWGGMFLTAVVGLWFRPQLEVLLQPILLGLLFPLLAVSMQNLRRREVPPVMSFDPLMDLETRSSVTRSRLPDEAPGQSPVLLRSPSGSTHDFLRTESGSGVS